MPERVIIAVLLPLAVAVTLSPTKLRVVIEFDVPTTDPSSCILIPERAPAPALTLAQTGALPLQRRT